MDEISGLESEFRTAEAALVLQINSVYSQPVAIRVASSEWLGGSLALLISSDGSWSGKVDMMGYPIGQNPPLIDLAEEYRLIIDDSILSAKSSLTPDYQEDWEREEAQHELTTAQKLGHDATDEELIMDLITQIRRQTKLLLE